MVSLRPLCQTNLTDPRRHRSLCSTAGGAKGGGRPGGLPGAPDQGSWASEGGSEASGFTTPKCAGV